MIRLRLLLIGFLLLFAVLPVVGHHPAGAQDDEWTDTVEQPGYSEELYYEDEPTYDPSLETDWSEEATAEAGDLSWLPNTPYRPLDFSPFAEALAKITPERMAELESLIVEANVVQLQQLMDAGKLTSQELVLFCIDRIQTYDVGQLDAITQLNPDALYIAHLRDIQRKNGEVKGPLQGIPVLLKENIATGDSMATTAGAIALADAPADHDAYLVQQLRDAGAVILGKTNMTEWANWMHMSIANGYSAFGGATSSPYGGDPSGSSTGSAVAVTANFAPLAIGTETIGSIISPSTYASVVGMHPTTGLVSSENIIPLSPTLDTAGPIGKTVTDIAVAMTVFAGAPDHGDPRSAAAAPLAGADFMAALDPDALAGATIGLVPPDPAMSEADTVASFDAFGAVTALEAAGATVVVVYPTGMPEVDWWQAIACGMRDGIDRYLQQNGATNPGSLADIVAMNAASPDIFMPLGQARLEEALACELTPEDEAALLEQMIATAQQYLDDLLATSGVDALVTIDDSFALEYGVAGYPAITVPRGAWDGASPTSITFVGPRFDDARLIGYAYAFEQTGPYRLPPTLVPAEPAESSPEAAT